LGAFVTYWLFVLGMAVEAFRVEGLAIPGIKETG
jgi:hypothetical protein